MFNLGNLKRLLDFNTDTILVRIGGSSTELADTGQATDAFNSTTYALRTHAGAWEWDSVNSVFKKTEATTRDLMTENAAVVTQAGGETTILAAGAAGVFHDLTLLVISTTTAGACTIKDSTGGTTRFVIGLPTSGTVVIPFNIPFRQATAANNWTATTSQTMNITIQAVKKS